CEQLVAEEPLEAHARASLSEVLSETIFGYVDVLSGRTLDEYRAERARWAPSAEKLRYDTIATILAGEPVDAESASQILHYPLEVSHVALVLWVGEPSRDVRPDTLLRAAAQELASLAACNSSLVVCASRLVAWAWLGFRDH